jgi:hypothetical protein
MARTTLTKQLRELRAEARAAVLLARRFTPHLVGALVDRLAIGERMRTRPAKVGATAVGVVAAGAVATRFAARHRPFGPDSQLDRS